MRKKEDKAVQQGTQMAERKEKEDDVLDFLKRMASCIAVMFGDDCETLIHDMSKPGHPIVAIYNSKVSGRKPGSTRDIYGNDSLETALEAAIRTHDYVNSQVITKDGKKVKSSTINFKGKGFSYAIGINYDYTLVEKMTDVCNSFINVNQNLFEMIEEKGNQKLDEIMDNCLTIVGKDPSEMNKKDRVQVVRLLKEQEAFQYQKAVTYISERLGVSRYTIYNYIEEVERM